MLSRTRTRLLGSLVLSGLGVLAACSSPGEDAQTSSSSDAVTLGAAMTPAWATTSSFAGRVDSNTTVRIQVHLRMRNASDAKAELEALSNPDDARYGQYLTDDQFNAKYAPTAQDVAAVRAHLEGNGLRVTELPDNRAYVAVEGAAGQVEKAFSTRLGQYRVGNETRHAPMDAVKLPSAVAARVSTVLGLSTQRQLKSQLVAASSIEPEATAVPRICTEYMGQIMDTTDPAYGAGYPSPLSYVQCGYKPAQLRALYGVNDLVRGGTDGHGQKVAIVDAFTPPTLVQDVTTYFANEDADYPLGATQVTLLQGPGTPQTPDTGWYGESSLDVEAVHAIAPGAQIVYVGAQSANDTDLIAAVNMIVSKRLASVVSNSYAGLESQSYGVYTAWQEEAIQAGLKGIGLYFASGDSGDESASNGGTPTVDFPASLAEVTAVGGTSLAAGADGSRLFELGWQDGLSRLTTPTADAGVDAGAPFWNPAAPGAYIFGAGGGTSQVYLQPSWQKGIVPTSLSAALNAQDRVIPDVSMLADPETGYIIGMTSPRTGAYGESAIGGTSLATPLFTATVAIAQAHARRTFGFANPLFYKASKKGAFTDIAPETSPEGVAGGRGGAVVTFDYHGAGNTNVTAAGFDAVTGLGVPNGAKFFAAVK